jgi:SAM-dependent methyltransferase
MVDVGCGRGYAIAMLQKLGYRQVEGIDADASQVAFARRHGLPATHVADTATWLNQRPRAYGGALLLDVLEHIPKESQPDFLEALANSLQPDAPLILTVPNAGASLAGYWRHVDYTHHMSFTPASLEYLLVHTGFESVNCHEIELAPPGYSFRAAVQWFFRRRRRLEFMAEFGQAGARLPVTPNLLAVAIRRSDAPHQL